jgi:hypothetical protein
MQGPQQLSGAPVEAAGAAELGAATLGATGPGAGSGSAFAKSLARLMPAIARNIAQTTTLDTMMPNRFMVSSSKCYLALLQTIQSGASSVAPDHKNGIFHAVSKGATSENFAELAFAGYQIVT